MPQLPAVPGVIAVDHRFTLGSDQNVHSKMHFRYTSAAPSVAALGDLAAAIEPVFAAHVAPQLIQYAALNEVAVQDLSDPSKPVGLWSGSLPGVLGGNMNPASIAVVAAYHIARRYRGGHPRGYWPLGNQAQNQTPGQWLPTFVTAVTNALTGYVTAVLALAVDGIALSAQVSVSYYSGGAWADVAGRRKPEYIPTLRVPPLVDTVTGITVNPRMGSQRRRLKKA